MYCKLLTRERMITRDMHSDQLSVLCVKEEASHAHLFFECENTNHDVCNQAPTEVPQIGHWPLRQEERQNKLQQLQAAVTVIVHSYCRRRNARISQNNWTHGSLQVKDCM